MAHITFIHGMANKPAPDRLYSLWGNALQRDDPRPDIFPSPNEGIDLDTYSVSSEMVYWADVFYESPDTDESGYGYESGVQEKQFEGVPREIPLERSKALPTLETAALPADEQRAMERIARQLGIDQEFPDDRSASADELTRAARGEYRLERIPLPWFIKKEVLKILLRDVHHYLFNSTSNPRGDHEFKVRDELRTRLLDALKRGETKGGPHILVSHSMGTIIAYDVLRNCPQCPAIDHLVTLGSPLGIDEVQDKLKHPGLDKVDYPAEKLRGEWVNIFDHLDPVVAFDPYFANDYRKDGEKVVKDINEQNWGDWRHSIQKYLSGPLLRGELRRLLNL